MRWRRKKHVIGKAEEVLNKIMDLMRDLDPKDYRKIMKAIDKWYESYQIVRGVVEDDIDDAERKLTKEREV
jgi:hypothetical protein